MYDLIIVGSGPGGYVAAAKAGKAGLKTLVIEKNDLGGVCLHSGCIPTKALLASAQRLLEVKEAAAHGIEINGEISFRWSDMQQRKDKVVSRLTKGIEALFKQSGVQWIKGEAKVLSATEVEVGTTRYQTKHVILATGAHSLKPDIPGLDAVFAQGKAYYPTEILALDAIPERLLILGDNVYAVEYASLFSALGAQVTVLSSGERLLPYMDFELSDFLRKELSRQKIEFVFGAEIKSFSGMNLSYTRLNEEKTLSFDGLLIALGSAPNLNGLEDLALKLTEKGFIATDEYMRTSIDGLYAIGDVNGYYPLAHVASAEGLSAVAHILGKGRAMRYDRLPMAVYAFPEVASVGLSEEKAKAKYDEVRVSKYFMSANGKALAEGDSKGFVKILSVAPYDEVVGMHIAGNKATDLIAEGVLALQLEATLEDLSAAVHAHPTPSEIIMEAAGV